MDLGTLSRESREQVAARASETPASAPADSPYVDACDPQAIPGTKRVALVQRDKRTNALYACSRGASGGMTKRVHMDVLAVLGFVHVSDIETLAEAGFIRAPEPTPEPPAEKPADAPKQPAKKASDSK